MTSTSGASRTTCAAADVPQRCVARQPTKSKSADAPIARLRARLRLLRSHRPALFYVGGGLLALAFVGAASVTALVLAVYLGAFGAIPTLEVVASVETPEASWLLDREGRPLARFYEENREVVDIDELSPALIEALLATEDARFFEHQGVDWQATTRAIVYSGLLGRREQGGGSTLSQQLAKNHFPRQGRGLFRLVVAKIREAFTAARFEEAYSKEELIALYFNTVPFGENLYGIKVAAHRFFDVDPPDLTTEQAAVLVGMLKANSSYNPARHPERSRQRRDLVLRRMAEQGFITPAESDSLQALPLVLNEARERTRSGASYFSERLRGDITALLGRVTGPAGEGYDLNTSGLRITTTLDADLQAMAERALVGHLSDLQPKFDTHWADREPEGLADRLEAAIRSSPRWHDLLSAGLSEEDALARFGESRTIVFSPHAAGGPGERRGTWRDSVRAELLRLRGGLIVTDPHHGEVLAYVGGSDFDAVPFNSAAARRQVGSTFKPIVYAAAIEGGAEPCDYFGNEQQTYPEYDDWTPGNADGQYGGEYSLTGALVNSVNTVAVQLAFRVGPERIVQLAEAMGLEGVPAEPSIALGTPSLTLEDMARVYGTFARGGTVADLRMITRIETRDGDVVYQATEEPSSRRVYTARTGLNVDFLLRQAASRGTGASLASRYGVRSEVAGKTGTTQDQADGWFVGYTRDLVVGAWVGGAYPDIRWRSLSLGQGARTALPAVGRFLAAYERAEGVTELPELPEGLLYFADCDDFIEDEPGGLFRDLFSRRDRDDPRVRRRADERRRRSYGPAPVRGSAEARDRRAEANRELERRRSARAAAARSRERDRKRAARQERRKRAFEQIFGRRPD